MDTEDNIQIQSEDKEHVRIHRCDMPPPISATAIKLEMKHGNESRYRIRIEDGVEGRITVSKNAHYQQEKLHQNRSVYLLHKGWIAILVPQEGGFRVDIGFARSSDHFFVEAPGKSWYAAYLSHDVVFTFASSYTDTAQTRDYEVSMPDEEEILELYAMQRNLLPLQVKELVKNSFG